MTLIESAAQVTFIAYLVMVMLFFFFFLNFISVFKLFFSVDARFFEDWIDAFSVILLLVTTLIKVPILPENKIIDWPAGEDIFGLIYSKSRSIIIHLNQC